jgi:uncharacterized metal-binding protein/predicted Fe-Mo cluster-binding NifX family protein
VAPRYAAAEELRLVTLQRGAVTAQNEIPARGANWVDLLRLLNVHQVDVLVCGGIDAASRDSIRSAGVTVIDNVACSVDEVLAAMVAGTLRPGYGFISDWAQPPQEEDNAGVETDCLGCRERVCLDGRPCPLAGASPAADRRDEVAGMLEAAADISFEDERLLCRLSELIYFALEMNYRRLGVAFCVELLEPTEILVGVLKRFFDIFAVGCKVGGNRLDGMPDMSGHPGAGASGGIACNPLGQARVLNDLDADLNVAVGLCVGADAVFARASEAPVSTLIVKDRSLAHNPIGALYSEYYLGEASRAEIGKGRAPAATHETRI